MSADLFAEFDSSSNATQPPQRSGSSTSNTAQGQGVDWFQTSNNTQPAPPQPAQSRISSQPPNDHFGNWKPAAIAPQSTSSWSSSQPQTNDHFGNWGASTISPQPTAPVKQATQEDDDDGWGDFEVAQTTDAAAKFPSLDSQGWDNQARITDGQPPRTRLVRASTMDLITNSLIDVDRPSLLASEDHRNSSRTQSKPRPPVKNKRGDPNVLFDVAEFELGEDDIKEEDEDEFDEFGDFEITSSTPAPSKSTARQSSSQVPVIDLLSLDGSQPSQPSQPPPPRVKSQKQLPERLQNVASFAAASATGFAPPPRSPYLQSAHSSYPQAPKSPSFHDRNPFPELAIKTPTATEFNHKDNPQTETPVTAWPSFTAETQKPAKRKDEDDGWGAWEDDEGVTASKKADIDGTKPPESWDWDAVDNVEPATTTHKPSDTDPPPINVPPPSIILSVFPDLLDSGATFFKPISKQSASIKQQILADPKAVDFLHGYILLATTAARVIAGRKHRWHRDKILAKSMSISAAGSKGMKLAGVDKTQSTREDREAADVVVTWRENVGRLRSAVAAANAAGKTNIKVPELSENLQIQTAKMVPTAAKPCIICGLKREERVTKVDFDVEDSFGEWWVEHWGHRACKNFWVEHETKLRQR